jgi:hypothetical protein
VQGDGKPAGGNGFFQFLAAEMIFFDSGVPPRVTP